MDVLPGPPDFILMRFRIVPGAELDVHSFELKAEFGGTDLAVYESRSNTVQHFAYLVWHLPEGSLVLSARHRRCHPEPPAFSRARNERFRDGDVFRRVSERVVEACLAARKKCTCGQARA
jgi:hypothetical protein